MTAEDNFNFSDMAVAAISLHELYVSFRNAGFSEAQAMELVGRVLAEGARSGMDNNED